MVGVTAVNRDTSTSLLRQAAVTPTRSTWFPEAALSCACAHLWGALAETNPFILAQYWRPRLGLVHGMDDLPTADVQPAPTGRRCADVHAVSASRYVSARS